MSFTDWLIHTCTIEQFAGSALATGEITKTWSNRATGVPCRFVADTERYANETEGLTIATTYRLLVPGTVTVINQDRITNIVLTSSGGTVDAGPYEVLEVLPRNTSSGRGQHHVALELEKIT